MNITLRKFLSATWYIQGIIILDSKSEILKDTADIESIKKASLYYGINHELQEDNELIQRDVFSVGAIDSYLIVKVR